MTPHPTTTRAVATPDTTDPSKPQTSATRPVEAPATRRRRQRSRTRTHTRIRLRVRLVSSFVLVMLLVLAAAGGVVYWRVQIALDNTLNGQLNGERATLIRAWSTTHQAQAAMTALPVDTLGAITDPTGRLLAATPRAAGRLSIPANRIREAAVRPLRFTPGSLLDGKQRIRIQTVPLRTPDGQRRIGILAVKVGQRDEALRELLAQLTIANLAALVLAGAVAYRLTHKALDPVEHYREQAAAITAGATSSRLAVIDNDDEISRLGHTLNEMLDALQQSAEQQRQFLSDASHELRTPLTALKTELDHARRRPRTVDGYRRALDNLAIDADRLIRLTQQLLDLEAAQRPGSPQSCAASDLTQRAGDTQQQQLAEDRSLVMQVQPDLTVALPEPTLHRLVTNLLNNATTHGAGDITLTLTTSQHAPDLVVLTVHDQGQGLDPAFLPHAVGRWRQQDTARHTPGSGLGLAIVHELCTHSGAELRLCTQGTHHRYPPLRHDDACQHPEPGTTATLLLPRATAAD